MKTHGSRWLVVAGASWRQGARAAFMLAACGRALTAQSATTDLGVQGTAAYNLIWNATARASDGFIPTAWRFSGRIAERVAPRWYVGVSVGSLEYTIGLGYSDGATLSGVYDAVATSVVVSSYGQFYPLRHSGVFVRGGIGYASNRTYYPGYPDTVTVVVGVPDPLIGRRADTHLSLTGGVGIDIALRRHLAVTVSFDYTSIQGTLTGREAKSALLTGVGLTVR